MRHVLRTLALFAVISAAGLVFSPDTADAQNGYHNHFRSRNHVRSDAPSAAAFRRSAAATSSVRIEVSPKGAREEIEVYVNEVRAGVVDDFDGFFQRLYLEEGEYEIELRLCGYKPLRASISVARGSTYNLRGQLEALADDQS